MKSSVGLGLPEYSFNTDQPVVIVGAGLAGCAIAHALVKRGYRCRVYDQHRSIASAASALPAAVVRPAVSGDRFYKSYFDYAFDLCRKSIDEALFTRCGSLELTDKPGLGQPHFDALYTGNYSCEFVTAQDASILAATKLVSSAVHIEESGFVNPQELSRHWLQHKSIEVQTDKRVSALKKTQNGWQLLSDTDAVLDESHAVVLATAFGATQFNVTSELPLHTAVGQIDLFEQKAAQLQRIINGNGYLLPETAGVWCGATHHPVNPSGRSTETTDTDSQTNKETATRIAPNLSLSALPVSSFASLRTFTPDRLPVVGAVHDSLQYRKDYIDLKHGRPSGSYPPPSFHKGLYIATGLGSRGATQALLIGELIGDLISGDHIKDQTANQLQRRFLQALHPARFLVRTLRRGL